MQCLVNGLDLTLFADKSTLLLALFTLFVTDFLDECLAYHRKKLS